MRNQRELYRMRIEDLDWGNRVIFVPDSKTPEGRATCTYEPPRLRALACKARHKDRRLGVSFQAFCFGSPVLHRSPVSRGAAASRLPKELVLYCARHDYGTRVLMRTGNLAAVMRTMGHRDV